MRIRKESFIYKTDNKDYFVNLISGTIDEVPIDLSQEIKEKSKYNIVIDVDESSLSKGLIKELLERGHLTKQSVWEEEKENSLIIDKKRVRASLNEKSIAVILDKQIGLMWCETGFIENPQSLGLDKSIEKLNLFFLNDLLQKLKENEDVNSIDLWLDLFKRRDRWEEITDIVGKNRLKIKKIWTFVLNEEEKEQIIDWSVKYAIPNEIAICFKMPSSGQLEYFEIINDNILEEKNLSYERFKEIFSEKQYFNCPFIYNTFFLSLDGELDYCIDRVANKRAMDSIFIEGKKENLLESLYDIPCQSSSRKECNFGKVCDNTCWKLSEKVKKSSGDCIIRENNQKKLSKYFSENIK